jgi:hypothetical protein
VEEIAHKREWEVEPVCVEKVSQKRARLSQSVWRRGRVENTSPRERVRGRASLCGEDSRTEREREREISPVYVSVDTKAIAPRE